MSLKTNPKRKIFCQKLVSATVCFREQKELSQQNSDIKKQNKINCPKKLRQNQFYRHYNFVGLLICLPLFDRPGVAGAVLQTAS